ncbi:MAG: sigma-70 family RNA polymerase sigma factor [Planctomycetes bacterium]|nr:sigma-70 family RNA polymerase sigma factor [Planctomycetota bacterium]
MKPTKANAELFEQQALPHRQFLFGQAYYHTRNANDAEDLVQETFARAFEKFHLFEQGTNVKAWLSRIMSNHFLSDWRKRKARIQASSFDGMENVLPAIDRSEVRPQLETMLPGEIACDSSFLESIDERLRHGLENMSRRYREAFLMTTLCNMTCPEVARKLKVPVGTVMSRLHRAKAALREAYLQSA